MPRGVDRAAVVRARTDGRSWDVTAGKTTSRRRRYARLLVSEIKLYHEAVVDEGRRHGDLRTRLGAQITRARQLYDERVPPRVRTQSDFFEAELISTLADGNAALLGLAPMTHCARRTALGLTAVALLALGAPALTAQSADPTTALSLTSTAHPPLPADSESVWISPNPSARAAGSALTRGVAELAEGRADAALPLLSQPVAEPRTAWLSAVLPGRCADARRANRRGAPGLGGADVERRRRSTWRRHPPARGRVRGSLRRRGRRRRPVRGARRGATPRRPTTC